MRAQDSVKFSALAATSAPFQLAGGKYAIMGYSSSWSTGTFTLQIDVNGTNYVSTGVTALSTSVQYVTADLPPGRYKLVIANSVTADVRIERIPGE